MYSSSFEPIVIIRFIYIHVIKVQKTSIMWLAHKCCSSKYFRYTICKLNFLIVIDHTKEIYATCSQTCKCYFENHLVLWDFSSYFDLLDRNICINPISKCETCVERKLASTNCGPHLKPCTWRGETTSCAYTRRWFPMHSTVY